MACGCKKNGGAVKTAPAVVKTNPLSQQEATPEKKSNTTTTRRIIKREIR